MENEKRLLKVGDTIYISNIYGICNINKIERVTKTQAFSGNRKFDINIGLRGNIRRISDKSLKWDTTSYSIETPELIQKLNRQNILSSIGNTDFKKLNDKTLEDILKRIQEN